jgi:hypothetical protein
MAEQIGGDIGAPDVLTLQTGIGNAESTGALPGTATLTESPPVVHARATIKREYYARMQRTVVVRHTSDDRIVAMIEVLSPGNKSSRHAMRSLLDKAVAALDAGIHLLLVDVHPPGPRDPNGVHREVLGEIHTQEYVLPSNRLLTAVAYTGGTTVEAFVKHFAVGDPAPEMPLFLTQESYVRVPLEATYMAAWQDVPMQYQKILAAPA